MVVLTEEQKLANIKDSKKRYAQSAKGKAVRKVISKNYYERNKEELKRKRRERYRRQKEEKQKQA